MQNNLSYHYACVASAFRGIHAADLSVFEHKRDENGQLAVDQAIARFCVEFDRHAQQLIDFDEWGETYPYWLQDDMPLALKKVCEKRNIRELGDLGCSEQTFIYLCEEAGVPMFVSSSDQGTDWGYKVVLQDEGDDEVMPQDEEYSDLAPAMERARKLRKKGVHAYVSLYRACPGELPMCVADFYPEEKGSKEPKLENTMMVVTINGG